jgi:hypothetical protein
MLRIDSGLVIDPYISITFTRFDDDRRELNAVADLRGEVYTRSWHERED